MIFNYNDFIHKLFKLGQEYNISALYWEEAKKMIEDYIQTITKNYQDAMITYITK